MSNEAAERLRAALEEAYGENPDADRALDEALAAERRATVERLPKALLAVMPDRYRMKSKVAGKPIGEAMARHEARRIAAILDEEAAR